MDIFLTVVIVLVVVTAYSVYTRLTQRLEFLEHEVRWLRQELEALKPTEIQSSYHQT